jgi:SAM-dependent methyltransferase
MCIDREVRHGASPTRLADERYRPFSNGKALGAGSLRPSAARPLLVTLPGADQGVPDARNFFDNLAPRYDEEVANNAYTANSELRTELELVPAPVPSILDLGGGTGQTAESLLSVFPGAAITAVDISGEMVARLKSKWPTVTAVESDLRHYVDTCQQRFHLITAIGVLEFIPALPNLLSKVLRLLRPAGRAIVTYEPLITGFGVQANMVTAFEGAQSSVAVHRWHPHELTRELPAVDCVIVSNRMFVPYLRSDDPVIYQLLHVLRS